MDKGWWIDVKGQGYAYYRGYRPLAFCLAFAFFHLFFMTFAGCHKAARSFSRGRGTHVIHTCMNMYSYVIHTCMSTCDTYMYEHVFTCDTYMYEHVFICDTYMYEHMWYIHVWTCIHMWYIHVWTHVIHTCMNMYSYLIHTCMNTCDTYMYEHVFIFHILNIGRCQNDINHLTWILIFFLGWLAGGYKVFFKERGREHCTGRLPSGFSCLATAFFDSLPSRCSISVCSVY